MEAVWQKIRADVVSRPLISLLIVVTIVAAAMLLTLAIATLGNSSAPYDRSFAELNAAHLWLYLDRAHVTRRDVERIQARPGVTASTGLRTAALTRIRIRETRVWVSFRALPEAPPEVNRLLVTEGRGLAPHEGALLASKDLDDIYTLAPGEEVEVTREGGATESLPVVGLAYNPMWDTYRNSQPPYVYVTEETFRDLFPTEAAWEWSVGLRLADPEAVDEVIAQVEALVGDEGLSGTTDWRDVKRSAAFGAQINFVFLGAFSLFAILATVLVIASSIGSSVLAQFRQIGMLKAIGFTRGQILTLYLGQYLLLALVGAPVGIGLGIALAPLPLKSVAASLSTPYRPPVDLPLVAGVVGICALVVTLASVGAANRGARANTVKAIAVGAEAPSQRPSLGVRLATALGLPMVLVLGLNDVFAKPLRSLMTGLNLTLGVIGIVFGLALNTTLDAYRADPSLLGIPYDARVTRDRLSDGAARHRIRQAPGVAAFYGEAIVDAETLTGESFQVRAVEGDVAAFPFRLPEGRFFRPGTNEAIAGRGLMDWLGLEVGDEVTLTLGDRTRRPVTFRIVGVYLEPVNVGQMLMVNLPTVNRVVRGVEARAYYLKLDPGADAALLKRYLEPRPDADLSFSLVRQAIPDAVTYLQLAIFALSAILIGIALVNVFNTSLLAMQEKVRVVGILKTVGMTPAQVVAMVTTAAGFLGLVATILGLPLGMLFTRLLLDQIGASYGFGSVRVALNPLYVLLLPPLMVGVSVLGGMLPGQRAARISIVDVLRRA